MAIDWEQFRDGDRVRVVFEGMWDQGGIRLVLGHVGWLASDGTLKSATSAELIERPFTPLARGTLFRSQGKDFKGCLWISLGAGGYRLVRDATGTPRSDVAWKWDEVVDRVGFLDAIEVVDV